MSKKRIGIKNKGEEGAKKKKNRRRSEHGRRGRDRKKGVQTKKEGGDVTLLFFCVDLFAILFNSLHFIFLHNRLSFSHALQSSPASQLFSTNLALFFSGLLLLHPLFLTSSPLLFSFSLALSLSHTLTFSFDTMCSLFLVCFFLSSRFALHTNSFNH